MSTGAGPARHRLRYFLREARARLRRGLGLGLHALLGPRGRSAPVDPAGIRSVLVVRINGRLGNTMFLTPLLRRLHELLPQARIDLAVSYPNAATLLEGLPGLARVILFPHKGGAGMAGRYLGALRTLRQQRYDLAIEPTQHSTGGRIVLALSRSRDRLGFATDTQWAPLTHAVAPPEPAVHMAREPLYLLAHGFGLPWDPGAGRLWLPLTDAELAQARGAVESALARAHGAGTPGGAGAPAIGGSFGFFAHATGPKDLGRQWWLDFWNAFLALDPQARPVEFLPGAAVPPVHADCAALHLPAQRQLAAAVAQMRLFICADGGPLHLAGSTGTPTIGLFNGHSDPVLYGPLKPADRSIDVRGRVPGEVAGQAFELWRRSVSGS